MRNLKEYITTKDLIRKCCNINMSIPKGYGTRSSDYEYFYAQKEELIRKIVEKIKQFQLPIKYGVNDGIIYFAFEGEQFSFHGTYRVLKKYNGNWIGTCRGSYSRVGNKLPGANNRY